MPLKYSNTKTALKIEWTSPDGTQAASFQIPKQATDEQQVKALLKALAFLGAQTGVVPPAPAGAPVTPSTIQTATPAPPSPAGGPTSGPVTAPRVPMMPPASLSDRPADGGPPPNAQFWETMPTAQVPSHLALGADSGWEIIPEGER